MQHPFHDVDLEARDAFHKITRDEVFAGYARFQVLELTACEKEGADVINDRFKIKHPSTHRLVLPQQRGNKRASAASDIQDCLISDLLPRVVGKNARSIGRGAAAQGTMELRYPALSLKIGEHVVVGVVVDLSAPARFVVSDRLGDAPCDVVELVAVELDPVVPLGPMVGTEELGDVIVRVGGDRGVVLEDAIIFKWPEYLGEAVGIGGADGGKICKRFWAFGKSVCDLELDRCD